MFQSSRKSQRWTERRDNYIQNTVEEALNVSDWTDSEDEILNKPKVIILFTSTDHRAWNTN